jgi:transcription antitermination factor NusG
MREPTVVRRADEAPAGGACEDGHIRIGGRFAGGDKVVIRDGPFAELAGVFEREIKGSDRVMILLAAVQYQSHVLVNIEQVKKM